jgi:hypothetical protein
MRHTRQPHINRRLDIDHGVSDAPPPRRQGTQEPGYWWNPTTQELIPVLPEDHPDYEQNAEIANAAWRRWHGGSK